MTQSSPPQAGAVRNLKPAGRVHLRLPVPPSANDLPSHHMELAKVKNRYRREVWMTALGQQKPPLDPPGFVNVSAIFFTSAPWDDDNRAQGMEFILDTLKQKQLGKVEWRQGLFLDTGHFIDDDPSYMRMEGVPLQAINAADRRVEIIIRWDSEPPAEEEKPT